MKFHARKPVHSLREWIDKLWICEDYRPSHSLEKKLPDASLAWIINLQEDRIRLFDGNRIDRRIDLPGSIIAGPRSTYYYMDTQCQHSCMGIQFKPGGALPFLGKGISQLKDVDIPLEDGLGGTIPVADLRGRLLETSAAEQRFQIVERFLLRCLERQAIIPRGHLAVAYALRMYENCPATAPAVADIANLANLSAEHLIRIFKEEVGLTPNQYRSIVRFQRTFRLIREAKAIPNIDLALSGGYYDQSHMYREFNKYANMTPTQLLRKQGIVSNHVPLSSKDEMD